MHVRFTKGSVVVIAKSWPTVVRSSRPTTPAATLEIDAHSGAGYLRLSKSKVWRTEVVREWPLLAVDYSAKGIVVGVETVGSRMIDIGKLLKLASRKGPRRLTKDYNFRVVTRQPEAAVA